MMLRKRRGFSLVELMTVVLITAIVTTFGASMISGSLDYYKTRRAAETLMWNLRATQEQAKARGFGAILGLKLYRGRVRDINRDGVLDVDNEGFSYLPYVLPSTAVEPANTLAGLTPLLRSDVINLPLGVTLTSTNPAQNGGDTFIRDGLRFTFNFPTFVPDAISPTGVILRSGTAGANTGDFQIDYRNSNYCALRSL